MKFLLVPFAAGLASALGFAPLGLWPVTLAAFALLLRLVATAPSLRSALARGYWFGAGQFMLGLNWIATAFTYQAAMPAWLGWVAVVLLSLYLAVYPAIAAGLAWRYGRGNSLALVLVFAAAWIVTEWLRATMFTGFAWNPVGVSMLPTSVSRLSTMVGTYGLSGAAVMLAGVLLLLVERALRQAAATLGAVAAATALAWLAGGSAISQTAPVTLHIVQPNIGQENKWAEGFEALNFERLRRLSARSAPEPRLLLWPEAAVTDPLQDARTDPAYAREIAQRRADVAAMLGPRDLLLTGGITYRSRDGQTVTSATNSVFAMDAAARILGRYDKAHLVPYGEYLPARPILSAIGLSRLAPGDIDFDSGPGARTLHLPGIGGVGLQLCYEMIFSGEVVDRGDRPSFLFNPSNDAWFGAWGPPQHLAQARLRALEEGLPVLRSTPTGISAVVDAEGRLLHSIPWRSAGAIEAALPPPFRATPFARLGNAASFLLALLLAAIAIAVRRKRR
jgi:apolipoprotein N-acyltransferase